METKYLGYRFSSVKITASCLWIWFAGIRLWIYVFGHIYIVSHPKSLKFVFFVSSVTSVISISIRYKWILKKIFQKCSRSPILTPGVSNRSSFKSRLTKSKSQVWKTVNFHKNSKNYIKFWNILKFFALISSFLLQFDDRYVS